MKKFNMKAKLFGLAVLATGATATVAAPAVMPSTVMAAEPAGTQNTNGWYEIVRNINIYYVNDDGSTTFGGTAAYVGKVSHRDMVFTFPEIKVADLFEGDMGYWKPDKETIPSVTGTYDNPPAEVNVYLRKDIQSYTEESKTITRTVKYYYVGTDGKKTSGGEYKDSVTFKRPGYIDGQGNKVMDDWSGEYTFKELAVENKTGYTPNMTKVPSKTVTPTDSDFTVEVIYSKIPTRTETQDFIRKINYIYKDTNHVFKTITQTVTLSRDVYTDASGKTVAVRDWNEGEFKALNVENVSGYTADKATVPSAKITVGGTPSDVNIYFTKNASDGNTGNPGASEGGSNAYEPVTETKTVKRTIKFVKKYTDGTTSDFGSKTQTATFSRTGYIDKNGKKVMPDWPQQTWAAVEVPAVAGFAAEKTVIPVATFTPDNAPGDETVYLNQLPTRTEKKTIKRTINFIGKKVDGQTTSLGKATQSVTLTREVYTDTDGGVKVKRDWNTGTIKEYRIPEKSGYIKQQDTVPAKQIKASDKDIVVNVYYTENYTGATWVDNVLTYFENGVKNTSFTGIAVTKASNKVYFKDGVYQNSFTGIINDNNNSLLFRRGIFDNSFTGAKWIDGVLYYFENGILNKTFSGVVKTESGKSVLFKNGTFQNSFTGIVKDASGTEMLFRKGIFDNSFTGAKWIDGVLYYFENGIINKTHTGIVLTESGKRVFFKNGVFQENFTGYFNSVYFKKGIEKK